MIFVKTGVVFKKLIPAIYNLFPVIDRIWDELAGFGPTITSANDSKHMVGSKHGTDEALDLRTINLSTEKKHAIVARLKKELTPLGYDVVFENEGKHGEHIHIEWDPK